MDSAQRLGRRWIGCDVNKGDIQTTSKRIQDIIGEQVARGTQGSLDADEVAPAQLSFMTWRVNDYDLNIHEEEAARLASEHLGLVRTRTDPYFDGTLGRSLVKIIAFNHPLSPVDLERLKRELEARPDEDRVVTVVCLGASAWPSRPASSNRSSTTGDRWSTP